MANVVQASEGGPQPCGQGFGHFGSQHLAIVDLTRVEAGLHPERGGFAERTGRAGRHQGANLIKVEKLERVRVHVASTRESKHEFAEATSIIARSVLSEPSRLGPNSVWPEDCLGGDFLLGCGGVLVGGVGRRGFGE